MTDDEPGPKGRLDRVSAQIAGAAKLSGRSAGNINLIAISKTRSAADISALIFVGQRAFGENRVQEAQAKWPGLKEKWPDIALHLVGQLQSNKAEDAVRLFDVIHSVDRLSLVQALIKAQALTGLHRHYFIQVNISNEDQKGGCSVADLPTLLAQARAGGLDIVGLMAVPPAQKEAAPFFALLAKLARDAGLGRLSMGMSGDFETAIMLGATEVRIGTALFGDRTS